MLPSKVPFLYLIPSVLLGAAVTFAILHKSQDARSDKSAKADTGNTTEKIAKRYEVSSQKPQKGLELIAPLLYASPASESSDYTLLKGNIMSLVENSKNMGNLTAASVFFVNFTEGEWMYMNPDQTFHPGSLIKVPMLITFLAMAEADSNILNKKIPFTKADNLPHQTYNSLSIQPGNTYTVRELLHYMIANSDNNATHLLNQNADLNLFVKVFTDLNLPRPDVRDRNFQISAKSYSEFLMVLYNSTYLSKKSSQFALELLTEVSFKDGIIRGLPPAVKVAHKFGEWGDVQTNQHELHEAGIVYLNDKPYLLTIMTRGQSPKVLSEEISKISKVVHDYLSEKQVNNWSKSNFSVAKN